MTDVTPGSAARRSGLPWLQLLNRLGPLLALIGVYLLFSVSVPNLLSLDAVAQIFIQTVIVGTAAVGMTLVIISGGIDLSVGSIIAFSGVAGAFLLEDLHFPAFFAVCGGILAGALCGAFNGMLITRAKVVPFIVTLGSLLIVRGAAMGLPYLGHTHGGPIPITNQWIRSFMRPLDPEQAWMLLPPGGWIMILLAVAFAAMLRYTRLGRHTYAIGSNEQTARLCGVVVPRVKLLVYMLSGACAGLSGVMLLSRLNLGNTTGAAGYELDVIAAVVIGGGSLGGGEGSILGSILGALIMTVIRAGCNLNGLEDWVTRTVTGAIIIVAVALDRLRHRRVT